MTKLRDVLSDTESGWTATIPSRKLNPIREEIRREAERYEKECGPVTVKPDISGLESLTNTCTPGQSDTAYATITKRYIRLSPAVGFKKGDFVEVLANQRFIAFRINEEGGVWCRGKTAPRNSAGDKGVYIKRQPVMLRPGELGWTNKKVLLTWDDEQKAWWGKK